MKIVKRFQPSGTPLTADLLCQRYSYWNFLGNLLEKVLEKSFSTMKKALQTKCLQDFSLAGAEGLEPLRGPLAVPKVHYG